jgi:hypothetical protein
VSDQRAYPNQKIPPPATRPPIVATVSGRDRSTDKKMIIKPTMSSTAVIGEYTFGRYIQIYCAF